MINEDARQKFLKSLDDPDARARLSQAIMDEIRWRRMTMPRPPVPDMPYIPGITKPLDKRGPSQS